MKDEIDDIEIGIKKKIQTIKKQTLKAYTSPIGKY